MAIMEEILKLFVECARTWGLLLPDRHDCSEQPLSGTFALQTADGGVKMVVRTVVLFEETLVIFLSHKGSTRPLYIKAAKYQLACEDDSSSGNGIDSERLEKYFNIVVFSPILRPGVELPALAHLSSHLLGLILSYVKVILIFDLYYD